MTINKLILFVFFCVFSSSALCQSFPELSMNKNIIKYNFQTDKIFKDTVPAAPQKNKVKKLSFGGIFISPNLGVAFPVGVYGDSSISGFLYGAKIEIGFSKLYPFVFGFVYENQKNSASPEFINSRFLTQFETEIVSLGGSLDILLNKYIKSNFTTPIFSLEIKYATISRQVSPADPPPPGIVMDESLLTYSAGLGFTIYVFDLSTKFTFAKDYSSLIFQAKFHFPIVNF